MKQTRVSLLLAAAELEHVRRAARHRRLSVAEFLREAAIYVAADTLTPPRMESDPEERRPVETYGLTLPRR